MPIRLRKFIGTLVLVTFSALHFTIAITVAIARLPGTSLLLQLGFYLVATALWFVVAAAIIYWMQKPPANSSKA